MTLADRIAKPSSERFQLIRMKPARYVTSLLAAAGGGLYTYSFGRAVAFASLEYNGDASALTKVSGTPTNNGEYSFDESTGTLTIKGAAPPDPADEHIVLFYYLFFSEGQWRTTYETPTDNASTLRAWEPRVAQAATIKAGFRNILAGKLTYDDTSFTLDNSDYALQSYLTENDSFANKDVAVWQVVRLSSDTSDVPSDGLQKLFTGRISSLSVGARAVTFQAYETTYALAATANFGASASSLVYNTATAYPGHNGRPRRMHFGETSYYKTFSGYKYDGATAAEHFIAEATEAYCSSYSASAPAAYTANRSWVLGFVKGALPTQVFGTIVRTLPGTGLTFVNFTSTTYVYVGDTISCTTTGTTYYGIVVYIGTLTYSGQTYNMIVRDCANGIFNILTTSTMNAKKSLGVFLGGQTWFPATPGSTYASTMSRPMLPLAQGRDYTLTETVDANNNNALSITLANSFETTYNYAPDITMVPLDPSQHAIHYRASSLVTEVRHWDVLQMTLTAAGFSTDSASFSAAASALSDSCSFSVPFKDEETVGTFADYVLAILRSTLGYLKVGDDGEIEYYLYAAPSSTDDRDATKTLDGSVTSAVEYRDIVTRLNFVNKHLPAGYASPYTTAPSQSSDKAEYLHGIVKAEDYEHVLALNGSSTITRGDEIFALRSSRVVTYRFDVATEDIPTTPGDDVQLTHPAVLGGAGVKDLKVIGISKSNDRVSVDATDLNGL